MRKIYGGIFFLLILYQTSFSQFAFHDAKKIKWDTINHQIFLAADVLNFQILANYIKKTNPNAIDIQTAFRDNPFFKVAGGEMEAVSFDKSRSSSFANSLGSLNVTNLADGIARFLIKRGREELNVAFLNRMKKFLDNPDHPECKTLFPITIEFLSSIQTYRYAELIQSLREAFYKDLSNLLVNLNELIDLPKYGELLKTLPEIRVAVRCSKIVNELSQSEEGILPDSLIHQLATLSEWEDINSNLGNSWKLLDIISQSIRYIPVNKILDTLHNNSLIRDTVFRYRTIDTTIGRKLFADTTVTDIIVNDRTVKYSEIKSVASKDPVQRRWIKLSDLNNLIKDKVTLQIFMGLLYQTVHQKQIHFMVDSNIIRVDSFLAAHANNIPVISGLIENFAILANDVDRTIKDFNDKQSNGTLNNDDYYTYISKAINITEYGFKVANTIKEGVAADDYIITARNANELYKNIYTKNYNSAVMNAYKILDQVFEKLAEKTSLNIKWPESELIEKIFKYANFMASVVKAQSGEDVQQALEAAALPAGSYSIKQKSAFNVSVNGYIGYGLDFNSGLYAHGLYAPLGISISGGSDRHRPTLSGVISLIDVGAVALYRLQNNSTETLKQEVRLESIFSPSAQIFLEYPGFPLAVGAGWRRTPKLFYSNNTSFTAVPSTSAFNVSILIDIPIFTIVNNPFYKR